MSNTKNTLLVAAFASLFSTRTVDGILGSINRNIAALDKAAAKHNKNGNRLTDLAEKIEDQAEKAYDEAARASLVKNKLQKLIS